MNDHDIFCRVFQQVVLRARLDSLRTQKQISVESGLTRQFIAQMEAGQRCPSFENFCSLALGLGLTPVELTKRFTDSLKLERDRCFLLSSGISKAAEYVKNASNPKGKK